MKISPTPLSSEEKCKIDRYVSTLNNREKADSLTLFDLALSNPPSGIAVLSLRKDLTWFKFVPFGFCFDDDFLLRYVSENLSKLKGCNLEDFRFTSIAWHYGKADGNVNINLWERQELEYYCEVLKSCSQ